MSSTKVLICDFWVVLILGLIFVSAEESKNLQRPGAVAKTIDDGKPKGNCSCGGFPTPTPENESLPLLSQMPGLIVACDKEGENTCQSLCVALATATKAKGPEILCSRIKDCNELKLSAFYKTCDNPWRYANMTAEQPLCCENTQVKTCPSAMQQTNSTTTTTTTLSPVDPTADARNIM